MVLGPQPRFTRKRILIIVAIVLVVLILGVVLWLLFAKDNTSNRSATKTPTTNTEHEDSPVAANTDTATPVATSHAPDHTKLPLGDNKYSASAKKGYVYSCQTSFNGGGAFTQGPWINNSAKTWDLNKKASVDGSVSWPTASWSATTSGGTRTIASKDLPLGHLTGIFPISSSDDAYSYDRNPNAIKQQTIAFGVPSSPSLLSTPACVGGEVGIATTGVLIFSAFDAGGRDAVATEVQDSCEGHPQVGNYYHYHGYSDCFKDSSGEGKHSDLLGYAFDGFGIFGIKGQDGKELSSNDLDECHGHTHSITWDGKTTSMYHYHFTHDFPYTVGCFRGTASVKALSSGESGGGQTQGQGQQQPPTGGQPPQGPPQGGPPAY